MQKNNPACIECSKGENNLHTWRGIFKNKILNGAICMNCRTVLTKEQAEDVWRE